MNRRPKIWIHRSARFWWGLIVLLVLQAAWITTMSRGGAVGFNRLTPVGYNLGTLSVTKGGLRFSLDYTNQAAPSSPFEWRAHARRDFFDVDMKPEFSGKKLKGLSYGGITFDSYQFELFLPGWIPTLIWIPWWLLRMRRGDQVEDAIAGQAQAMQVPGQDPV